LTVACVIQARLGSTRLPAKVLLPLPTGRTVLEEVIYRCKMIKGVDVVVVAIPDTVENDILKAHLANVATVFIDHLPPRAALHVEPNDGPGVVVIRGPEHDVLSRYAKAAEAVDAKVVIRVTADCPLIDPDTCGAVFKLQQETGAEYASNCWPARHFPHGWDCEVFTRDLLRRCEAQLWDDYEREHVTPKMQKADGVKRALLKAMEDRSHIRWTLDTLADYKVIWDEFKRREEAAPTVVSQQDLLLRYWQKQWPAQ
jgi:spore coat polysaccharide biosynthesis protein SpsF